MITATIVGHLGADAVQTTTQKGGPMTSLRVAVCTKRWPEDKTVWLKVLLFGDLASEYGPKLKRGMKVVALGRADLEEFTRRDGTLGSELVLFAEELEVGEAAGRAQGAGAPAVKPRAYPVDGGPPAQGRVAPAPRARVVQPVARGAAPPAAPQADDNEAFPW